MIIWPELKRINSTIRRAVNYTLHNDESGFDYFFQLLDEFLEEQNLIKSEKNTKENSSVLEEKKVRAFRIERDAMLEIVEKYISEHEEEIFNLQKENSIESRRIYYHTCSLERDSYICAVFSKELSKSEINIYEKIDRSAPEIKSIFQKQPYGIISFDDEKGSGLEEL